MWTNPGTSEYIQQCYEQVLDQPSVDLHNIITRAISLLHGHHKLRCAVGFTGLPFNSSSLFLLRLCTHRPVSSYGCSMVHCSTAPVVVVMALLTPSRSPHGLTNLVTHQKERPAIQSKQHIHSLESPPPSSSSSQSTSPAPLIPSGWPASEPGNSVVKSPQVFASQQVLSTLRSLAP